MSPITSQFAFIHFIYFALQTLAILLRLLPYLLPPSSFGVASCMIPTKFSSPSAFKSIHFSYFPYSTSFFRASAYSSSSWCASSAIYKLQFPPFESCWAQKLSDTIFLQGVTMARTQCTRAPSYFQSFFSDFNSFLIQYLSLNTFITIPFTDFDRKCT